MTPTRSTTFRLAPLILAPALVVSCTEQPAPTEITPPVAFGFLNGPASPGNSGIIRFQDAFFVVTVDFSAGLISFHGLENTIADLCNDLGEFDLMDFQLKPHQTGEINSQIVDESSPVMILALPAESSGDFCTDFSGAPVLYIGTASFVRTDNNFTPTGTDGGRANSFGWTSQGTLTDVENGGQVRYNETVRLLINPQTDEFTEVVSRIRVD